MALALHIACSVIGILGSYISAFSSKKKAGMALAMIGTIGVTISGIFLFTNDPEAFLSSGTFLSNMTVMLILICTESYFAARIHIYAVRSAFSYNRALSVISWTWIFALALISPPYSYYSLMAGYAAIALFFLYVFPFLWIKNV